MNIGCISNRTRIHLTCIYIYIYTIVGFRIMESTRLQFRVYSFLQSWSCTNNIQCLILLNMIQNMIQNVMLCCRMSLKHVLIYILSSSGRGRSIDDQLDLMTNYSQSTFTWIVASSLSVFAQIQYCLGWSSNTIYYIHYICMYLHNIILYIYIFTLYNIIYNILQIYIVTAKNIQSSMTSR